MAIPSQSTSPLEILIWGSSGHALVVADIIQANGSLKVRGFIDDRPESLGKARANSSVIGDRSQLEREFLAGARQVIIAIGDCHARLELANLAANKGFNFHTAIHPSAIIAADAQVGEGTVIAAIAVINPGAVIGKHVIINTSASVDHECVIDDGAHIGPGARLGGCVTVGRATWIGIGAVVKDHVKIGAGTIIGAGAVVVNDIPDGVVAYGVPAKVRRRVSSDD